MIALALCALAQGAPPQDTVPRLAVSGFVDAYYAYDFGRPAAFDRVYTTQAARHDEFNINLAHIALTATGTRARGRVALQAGTAVQANYAGEPSIGVTSGGSLSRHIQEATAGARIAEGLWLDAGVFFSYIGWEGWISRDNPTYTRSLVADYTPYYLSGARLTWQRPGSPVAVQLAVMNGWQNISETNHAKSVGARVDWQVTPALTLAWADFIGNELPDSVPAKRRVFNQAMAKLAAGPWLVQTQADVGAQGPSRWWGWVAIVRRSLTPAVAVSARAEGYADPDRLIVATGTADAFEAAGASAGLDVAIPGGALWRTELRVLRARAPLFPRDGTPDASRSNTVAVTSLALTF